MDWLSIVQGVNIPPDLALVNVSVLNFFRLNEFTFYDAVKWLCTRVIVTIALATHAADHPWSWACPGTPSCFGPSIMSETGWRNSWNSAWTKMVGQNLMHGISHCSRIDRKASRLAMYCLLSLKNTWRKPKKRHALFADRFSPHCFRHSKAIDLLQSVVNLIYIRDFLGHVDTQTTEIYARIDGEMKRRALEKGTNHTVTGKLPEWQRNAGLMNWLKNLGR